VSGSVKPSGLASGILCVSESAKVYESAFATELLMVSDLLYGSASDLVYGSESEIQFGSESETVCVWAFDLLYVSAFDLASEMESDFRYV